MEDVEVENETDSLFHSFEVQMIRAVLISLLDLAAFSDLLHKPGVLLSFTHLIPRH